MNLRQVLPRGTFRSLQVRNYRLFLLGSLAPKIGIWMQRVAQDWLVLELTGSGVVLGVASTLQFLPTLFAGLWGGAFVDRADRRRVLVATQVAQAILALALGLLTMGGAVTVWLVYLLALLLGGVTVVDNPARQAFLGEMVERGDVRNAQSLYSGVHNLGRLAGAAVAGAAVASAGAGVVFLLTAATFLPLLAALGLMDTGRLRRTTAGPRTPGQVREGVRYLWRRPELRLAMALVAVVAVFGQNFRVVLPLLAQDSLGGNAQTYGYLTAALGVGAVAGSLLSAGGAAPTGRSLLLACLGFGAVNLVVAVAPVLVAAAAAIVLLGAASLMFNTVARSLLLTGSDERMHGRVMALFGIVFLGGKPIGGPVIGWFCSLWGPAAGMAVAGGVAVSAAAALAPTLGRFRTAAGSAHTAPSAAEDA